MKPVRAASVQFNHHPGDKEANFLVVESFTGRAAGAGVQLLVFPEMCLTGYWHVRNLGREEIEALAEPVPEGASTQRLIALARDAGIAIGAGLIERDRSGNLYNCYVVAMPDGSHVFHRKIHMFISEHMSCGDRYTVFDIPGIGRAGILICYDNNIVENARATALAGAEILIAPHQTGGCDSRSPHAMKPIDPALWHNREADPESLREAFLGVSGREWLLRWLPSRAHDNGMFLVYSNGVGLDDDEVRTGNAMILDPYGRIIVETDAIGDDMVVADLDPPLLENATGRRWMAARRPDLYGPLIEATGRERDMRTARFSGEL